MPTSFFSFRRSKKNHCIVVPRSLALCQITSYSVAAWIYLPVGYWALARAKLSLCDVGDKTMACVKGPPPRTQPYTHPCSRRRGSTFLRDSLVCSRSCGPPRVARACSVASSSQFSRVGGPPVLDIYIYTSAPMS